MTEHAIDRSRSRGAERRAPTQDWRGLAWRQYRLERKMFWRNPSAAFFNFLLPLLFLGLFGAILSGNKAQLQILVPGIAGMAVMSTTFNALAFNITALREQGILKRVRGTPLPTSAYLAGIAGSAVTNTVLLPPAKLFDRLKVLSIAPLLAQAIRYTHSDQSVSSLFD